jgi:hypothetical protein
MQCARPTPSDSLSPMLFLLVMEVLAALIRQADTWSLFKSLRLRAIGLQASLYINDLVIFLTPVDQDIQLFRMILDIFAGASGLHYMSKCQLAAIRCNESHTQLATTLFLCQLVEFLVKYLGIPHSTRKLLKSALHPLLNMM